MPRPVARRRRRPAVLHVRRPDAPALGALPSVQRGLRLGVSPVVHPRGRLGRAPAAAATRQLFPAARHRLFVRIRVRAEPDQRPAQDPPERDYGRVQDEPAEELVQREDVHVRQKRLEAVPAPSGFVHHVHVRYRAQHRNRRKREAHYEVVALDPPRGGLSRRVHRSLRRPHRRHTQCDAQHDLIHEQRSEDPDLIQPKVALNAAALEVDEAHGQRHGAANVGHEVHEPHAERDKLVVAEPERHEVVSLAEVAPERRQLPLPPVDDAVTEHPPRAAPRHHPGDGPLSREHPVGGREDPEHGHQQDRRGQGVDQPEQQPSDQRVHVGAPRIIRPGGGCVRRQRIDVDVRTTQRVPAVVQQPPTGVMKGHRSHDDGPPHSRRSTLSQPSLPPSRGR